MKIMLCYVMTRLCMYRESNGKKNNTKGENEIDERNEMRRITQKNSKVRRTEDKTKRTDDDPIETGAMRIWKLNAARGPPVRPFYTPETEGAIVGTCADACVSHLGLYGNKIMLCMCV